MKTKMIAYILSDHNRIKLDINTKKLQETHRHLVFFLETQY